MICDKCGYKGRDDGNCNPSKLMQIMMEGGGSCETCGGTAYARFFQAHTDLPLELLRSIAGEANNLYGRGLRRDLNHIAEQCLKRRKMTCDNCIYKGRTGSPCQPEDRMAALMGKNVCDHRRVSLFYAKFFHNHIDIDFEVLKAIKTQAMMSTADFGNPDYPEELLKEYLNRHETHRK